MNKTDVITYEKVMMTLRLPPETYATMIEKVQKIKKEERGFSVNQYLTELVERDLKDSSSPSPAEKRRDIFKRMAQK